jgi:DNA polymerase-3 subunit beta
MKALCPREGLLAACQLASVAVASRDVKPILKNLKAIAGEHGCTLMATDLELGIRIEVRSVQVDEAGEAVLPAGRLTEILRESSDQELTLEATSEASFIRGESSEFEMPGDDPAEFPDIPTFTDAKYHEVAADVLRTMIRRTVFAAAKESPRYAITGILWEFTDGQAKLVATDGRRLAVATGPANAKGGADAKGHSHVVPTKAMSLLERLLQDTEEPVRVSLRPNEALFKTDRAMIYSRLVEGRFPPYGEVIPKKPTTKIPLEVGKFQAAVRQAKIMTDDESKRVNFTFSAGKLTLQAKAAETGRSRVDLPVEYAGANLTIGLDPGYLTDMLRILPPDAPLVLEIVDPISPALLRCGPEYLYVIMPLT